MAAKVYGGKIVGVKSVGRQMSWEAKVPRREAKLSVDKRVQR